MKLTNKLCAFAVILFCCLESAHGQEFYEDGSMKLTEVSTDAKYGFEPNHKTAISVGKIENEQAYLKALRGPNGERVEFRRVSSCCTFKSKSAPFGKGMLDRYEVYHDGLDQPTTLYLNGYSFDEPKAALGFTFVKADQIEKPVVFPEDSLVKVDFCNMEMQYAAGKEWLLEEKIGEKPEPDTNSVYEGGVDALKSYFAERPLMDERIKNAVFRVSIAFVVNCEGKAGNFMIITKGKGLAETFANQVLERVNKMPQKWKPAFKNEKAVDSYQVLSFTVSAGKLDNVSYR